MHLEADLVRTRVGSGKEFGQPGMSFDLDRLIEGIFGGTKTIIRPVQDLKPEYQKAGQG